MRSSSASSLETIKFTGNFIKNKFKSILKHVAHLCIRNLFIASCVLYHARSLLSFERSFSPPFGSWQMMIRKNTQKKDSSSWRQVWVWPSRTSMAMNSIVPVRCLAPLGPRFNSLGKSRSISIPFGSVSFFASVMMMLFLETSW